MTSPLEHDHSPQGIADRLRQGHRVEYFSDWIYGGIDGAITTFAIVAGSVGAGLSARVILILGFSNIVADGLSMAAANFTGTKAQNDNAARLRAVEERHVRLQPAGEREEIRQIFEAKGFSGQLLDQIVQVITSDKRLWIETMLTEEHGIACHDRACGDGLCLLRHRRLEKPLVRPTLVALGS
jgi:VIT1/CCC1 family predicted Fe2+/Mn2+ transporter